MPKDKKMPAPISQEQALNIFDTSIINENSPFNQPKWLEDNKLHEWNYLNENEDQHSNDLLKILAVKYNHSLYLCPMTINRYLRNTDFSIDLEIKNTGMSIKQLKYIPKEWVKQQFESIKTLLKGGDIIEKCNIS